MPESIRVVRNLDPAVLEPLKQRTVAVLGFGNQGHAHALNLRDSGINVVVAARANGSGSRRAESHGFDPLPIDEAVAKADLIIMALPDEVQAEAYQTAIAPRLRPGAIVGFLHGFNICYGLIDPPQGLGVILVAPKGPGALLRQSFVQGRGIPCVFAVHQDTVGKDAEAVGLAWAHGIGCARAGIIYTTFKAETETDLFGEQAVLCGGLCHLIRAAFETLVEAGYSPELAYLECCHEVKQIADLIYERGPAGMRNAISTTAEYGIYHAGPQLIDETVREKMRLVLQDIRTGKFAAAFRADYANGFTWLAQEQQQWRTHPIEDAGKMIRSLMPWLAGSKQSEPDSSRSMLHGKDAIAPKGTAS